MKKIVCLFFILLMSVCTVSFVSAASLQSDEFNGSGQDVSSFWNIQNGDKSNWELKDGMLVVEAGFGLNVWQNDDSTRYSQTVDQDEFDIETSLIADYADGSIVTGLIVYSAGTKDSQGRDGEWVTLKLWGRGAAQGNNAVLQYQRRQNDSGALGYVGTQPDYNPAQGVLPIEMRLKREGNVYESWFKPNAEGDWIPVGKVTNELQEPLEVGIYAGVADGGAPGRLTVSFDYFREASAPAPVDPQDRLTVTWGELKDR